MSEHNPYEFDKIPEFAMQPARENIDDTFDPSIYERLLSGLEQVTEAPEGDASAVQEAGASEPTATSQEAETEAPGLAVAAPVTEDASEVQPETASASAEQTDASDLATDASESVEAAAPAPENAPEPQSETAPETAIEVGAPTLTPAPELAAEEEDASESAASSQLEGATVISAGGDAITDGLRLVDMTACQPARIYVEEDILVPDVKPDLASVLSMDATLRFSEREGKISGELMVQTLYIPQGKGADCSVIAMESRIPFQQSGTLTAEQNGEGETVGIKASAAIESLDYSVINERKFRVKAAIAVDGREYHSRKLELFQGLKTDDVQMLKETITVTDVISRKNERLELEEDLLLPDSLPEVGSVLRCDVNLVENHKQISREKVVISGTAYCNIMYLPLTEGAEEVDAGESGKTASFSAENPVLFQGKSEFTQFVALGSGGQTEQPTGGRVFFQKKSAVAEPKENENGLRNILHLNLDGETFVELYRDIEQPIVTDAYHHQKEMIFDRSEISLMQLCPGGVAETTVREVVSIPDVYEGVDRVAFLSGDLAKVTSKIEGNKNVVEGLAVAKLVCLADDENATPFSLRREVPFRVVMDLPGNMEEAVPDNETLLKELRVDRLNNRQIELSASVIVNSAVIGRKQCPLIRNVGFLENSGAERETPGFVLYITRSGDTLWKIARRYRTTIDTVAKINGIDQTSVLKPGTKLLIVK